MEELNMMNFAPQVIQQAKAAKSVEELMALAKENCFEMTPEEAATYFAQLNPVTGDIDDEELENVSGGATCKADDGRTYTTVTSGLKCFNGQFLTGATVEGTIVTIYNNDMSDNELRITWALFSKDGQCGRCRYLEFDGATGYCAKSLR